MQSNTQKRIDNYDDFFLFYLNEHAKRATRIFHYVGTSFALACIAAFFLTWSGLYLLAGLVGAYGLAWVSHFFIEHNKPATFTYPLWSYVADHHMLALAVSGRLQPKLQKAKAKYGA